MKQLSLILLSLCIISCNKENRWKRFEKKYGDIRNSGTVTARLNGEPVQFHMVRTELLSATDKSIYIEAVLQDEAGKYGKRMLSIRGIDLKEGNQVIHPAVIWINDSVAVSRNKPGCIGSFYTGYGDYSEDSYEVDGNRSNNISIESYSPSSPRVIGKFNLTLYYTPSGQGVPHNNGLPDTLVFTDGQFNVDIMSYN